MDGKTEIVVCLGSSCFSRGNRKLVATIQEYITNNGLEEQVYFHGNHCFNNCSFGPILKVNDLIYKDVDSLKVIEILDNYLKSSKTLSRGTTG